MNDHVSHSVRVVQHLLNGLYFQYMFLLTVISFIFTKRLQQLLICTAGACPFIENKWCKVRRHRLLNLLLNLAVQPLALNSLN